MSYAVKMELRKQYIYCLVEEKGYIFKYEITKKTGEILYSTNCNLNINLNCINPSEIQSIIDKYWGDGFYSLTQFLNSKHEEIQQPEPDPDFNILDFMLNSSL